MDWFDGKVKFFLYVQMENPWQALDGALSQTSGNKGQAIERRPEARGRFQISLVLIIEAMGVGGFINSAGFPGE